MFSSYLTCFSHSTILPSTMFPLSILKFRRLRASPTVSCIFIWILMSWLSNSWNIFGFVSEIPLMYSSYFNLSSIRYEFIWTERTFRRSSSISSRTGFSSSSKTFRILVSSSKSSNSCGDIYSLSRAAPCKKRSRLFLSSIVFDNLEFELLASWPYLWFSAGRSEFDAKLDFKFESTFSYATDWALLSPLAIFVGVFSLELLSVFS